MYGFGSFKFVEVSFMVQELVYFGEYSMGTWKVCVLCILSLLGGVFYVCQLDNMPAS